MRLDDVKEHFGDRIAIEWKSFMLRSTDGIRRTREEFIAYTRNWVRLPEADARLEVTAPWASEDEHPSHSLPALAASKLAATYGLEAEEAFHRAMFKAYFSENRTISDKGVIAAIAGECGLDPTVFAAEYQAQELTLAGHEAGNQRYTNGHCRRPGLNSRSPGHTDLHPCARRTAQ